MKKALSILLSLIMVIGMIPMAVFSVAADTTDDGYTLISSLSDIDSTNGGKYRLSDNIIATGETWSSSVAIGADTEIDGAGYSITGFTLTADGIFSLTAGKTLTIKNLTIGADGANITHTPSGDAGILVGAFGAEKTPTSIVIDNVDVYVNVNSTTASKAIGGMIGAVKTDGRVTISNSTVNGSVNSVHHAAGFVGCAHCGLVDIQNCVNNASVTGAPDVGGFVAYVYSSLNTIEGYDNYAMIKNCTNNGDITMTGTTNGAGGIVGYSGFEYAPFSVIDCVNTGKVTSNVSAKTGGILGYYHHWKSTDTIKTISGCVNYGDISTTNSATGGIIGETHGNTKNFSVIDCVNYGEVKELHSVTQSSGNGRVAGIVGQLYGSTGYVIDGCVNYGSIVNARCGGGISGLAQCATLTTKNCANFGSIQSVNGAGGLFGITKGGTIVNCIVGAAEISAPFVGSVISIAEAMVASGTLTVDHVLNLSSVSTTVYQVKNSGSNTLTATISATTIYSLSAEGATVEDILNTANSETGYTDGDVTYKFTDIVGKFKLNSAETNIVPATPVLQGYQVGQTETKTIDGNEVEVYSLRILATINDTLDYDFVGFNILINGEPYTEQSENGDYAVRCVYTSIQAADGGAQVTTTAEELGGKYIYACILDEIPVDGSAVLTINAFAEKGTERYEAGAYTVTIQNGKIVPNAQ